MNVIVLENFRVASEFCRSTKSHGAVGNLIRNNIEFCSLGVEAFSEEQIAEVILMGFDIKLITVYRSLIGYFVRLRKIFSNVLNKVSICRSTIIRGIIMSPLMRKMIRLWNCATSLDPLISKK